MIERNTPIDMKEATIGRVPARRRLVRVGGSDAALAEGITSGFDQSLAAAKTLNSTSALCLSAMSCTCTPARSLSPLRRASWVQEVQLDHHRRPPLPAGVRWSRAMEQWGKLVGRKRPGAPASSSATAVPGYRPDRAKKVKKSVPDTLDLDAVTHLTELTAKLSFQTAATSRRLAGEV